MTLQKLQPAFRPVGVRWYLLRQTQFTDLPKLRVSHKTDRRVSTIRLPVTRYVGPYAAFFVFTLEDCYYLDYVRGVFKGAFFKAINSFLAQASMPVVTAIRPTNLRAMAAAKRLNSVEL
jgi:hypothetical protein